MMVAEKVFASPLGKTEAYEESRTLVYPLSTEPAGTSHDLLFPLVNCASPMKNPEEPADVLKESSKNWRSQRPKTSSVSTRRRTELKAVLLEEYAPTGVIFLGAKFELREEKLEMELEVQKVARELAAIEQEKDLERKIRKRNMEAENGSSLERVRTSINAEDKTKRLVTSPIKNLGETRDPLVTVATVTSN